MKRSKFIALFGAALMLALAVFAADVVIIKVQATKLRLQPKFFAQTILSLQAGDRLEKVGESEGWIKVKTSSGIFGWVHSSAAETPKFALSAMNTTLKSKATASEVALAGKGFNKQVEESYRAAHGDISFVWVDRMLVFKANPAQVEDFLRRGRLGEYGGAK
jgi:hypothetical protein